MFFAANNAKFGFVNTLSANIGYHLATYELKYSPTVQTLVERHKRVYGNMKIIK